MILLLGAGASKYFGIPTTFEMPDFLWSTIESRMNQGVKNLWQDIKRVFGEKFDLEILLTVTDDLSKPYIEMKKNMAAATASFIIDSNTSVNQMNQIYREESAKKLSIEIRNELRKVVNDAPRRQKESILRCYDRLFHLLPNYGGGSRLLNGPDIQIAAGPISIFSTNYDLCVETYFYERKIDFTDGMIRRRGPLFLDVAQFMKEPSAYELIKMHGSINWFKNKKGEILEWPFQQSDREEMLREYLPFGEQIIEDVIIYPTETGGDRRVMQSPYADFYHLLRQRFASDPTIFIIGFSLREQRICGLIDDVIHSVSKSVKIILVDPKASEIKSRIQAENQFKALGEAIKPVNLGFENELNPEIGRVWSSN